MTVRWPGRSPLGRRRSLEWYFEHNDGRMMDKWVHYFDIYERHFDRFRGRSPVVLELGVSHGGSLDMWRWYFGRGATVVGVDIDARAASLDGGGVHVHVGDQADSAFLSSLVDRYGRFDVVIDDGSHLFEHQLASLQALWDRVAVGGVYLVEDVCTSYLERFGGGLGREDTFIGETKRLLDEVNGDWLGAGADPAVGPVRSPSSWTRTLGGIHVYDSVVVLDRTERPVTRRRQTGRPAFDDVFGVPVEEWITDDHRRQLERLGSPMARLRRSARDPRGALGRLVGRLRRSRAGQKTV